MKTKKRATKCLEKLQSVSGKTDPEGIASALIHAGVLLAVVALGRRLARDWIVRQVNDALKGD
jgi:hypothetical protein